MSIIRTLCIANEIQVCDEIYERTVFLLLPYVYLLWLALVDEFEEVDGP